jgi:translation initiation factor 1
MTEIDPLTGLPKEMFDNKDFTQEISKEQEKIKIRTMKRAFRKLVTVISGFENADQAKELGKLLKKKLACGGTVKGKEIELQGEHARRAKEVLIKEGYKEEHIDA